MTFFDRGEEMVFEDAFQLNTLWQNLIFGPQSPFKWKCSPSCSLGTKPGFWPPCAVSLCSPPRPSFLPDYLLSWFLSFQEKSEKGVHFSMLDQHYVKFSAFHGDQNEWIGGSTSLLNTVSGIRAAELAKNAKTPWSGSCLERKKCVTNCCSPFFSWLLRCFLMIALLKAQISISQFRLQNNTVREDEATQSIPHNSDAGDEELPNHRNFLGNHLLRLNFEKPSSTISEMVL